MAPHASHENDSEISDEALTKLVAPQAGPRKYDITWSHAIPIAATHIAAVFGLYLLRYTATWKTVIFTCIAFYISTVSVCAGAHRLWSHRSYKATKPMQIFLMLGHCLAYQHSIFLWVKDHRLHHRYSETDADPYNSTRGFFYSHFGWVCVNRHPEVHKRGKLLDLSDMFANPIVMFQKKHRPWLNPTLGFILPTLIPAICWKESLVVAFTANAFRLVLITNGIFSINSFAHLFGTRPYDKNIAPTQNILTNLLTFGEGFHNYHHSFPYDYKAGEFGSFLNFSASFIEFCAWLGLAYDLKEVSKEVLEQRMARTGDGSDDKYGIGFVTNMIDSPKS